MNAFLTFDGDYCWKKCVPTLNIENMCLHVLYWSLLFSLFSENQYASHRDGGWDYLPTAVPVWGMLIFTSNRRPCVGTDQKMGFWVPDQKKILDLKF